MAEAFSDRELSDPLRTAKRLVLAAQDMEEARQAAGELIDRPAARMIETALAVSYARPWTSASIEPLEEHWLPRDRAAQELHFHLLLLRDKLYAHTDEALGARGIRDVSHLVGAPNLMFASEWRPLRAELLPAVKDLAADQRKRFRSAADEISPKVRRFAVEVRWSAVIALPARSLLLDELESEVFALHPTSRRSKDESLAVELELTDPRPDTLEFAYALRRLLRALKQWHRQLIPIVLAYVVVDEYRYVIPVGGAEAPAPAGWTHESVLADRRKNPPGDRVWDREVGRWRP